jgi:hypothetical protein
MRLCELLETKLDPHDFGVITKGPDLYLHYAHSADQIQSIVSRGFDLRHFGLTAKKYHQKDLMVHDPRGIFALDVHQPDTTRPYVIFRLEPTPNVLTRPDPKYPDMSAELKRELAEAYGFAGAKLAKVLLKANIHVLHSTSEYIILDPTRVVVVKSSL